MNVTTRIGERRNAGRTTCVAVPITLQASARSMADRAVEMHGLRGLGDSWLEISGQQAHTIATSVLHRDLAHGVEIMSLPEAEDLAMAFLDLAPEPHTYFTNGEWDEQLEDDGSLSAAVGFDPISNSTFDAGVICVGDGVVTILWVEDEE